MLDELIMISQIINSFQNKSKEEIIEYLKVIKENIQHD